jgi:hypothetical protein
VTYTEAPISFTVKVHGNLLSFRAESPVDFVSVAINATDNHEIHTFQDAVLAIQGFADGANGITVATQKLGATVVETQTSAPSPAPAAAPAAAGAYRTEPYTWRNTDQRGNEAVWEFNRPDAPALPDRPHIKYALKSGVNASGKSYRGWFDPAGAWQQGFPKGAETRPIFGDKVPSA